MHKIKTVLRLASLGLSQRKIALSCQLGQATVSDYLRMAAAAGLKWPDIADWDEDRLRTALAPSSIPATGWRKTDDPDYAAIRRELQTHKHLTLQLLWQEYREKHPNGYGYSRYCGLYRNWLKRQDVVLRHDIALARNSSSTMPATRSRFTTQPRRSARRRRLRRGARRQQLHLRGSCPGGTTPGILPDGRSRSSSWRRDSRGRRISQRTPEQTSRWCQTPQAVSERRLEYCRSETRPSVQGRRGSVAADESVGRAGVVLHLIDMGGASLNTASAMGRMLLTLMAGFAELNATSLSERTALHSLTNGNIGRSTTMRRTASIPEHLVQFLADFHCESSTRRI